MAHLLLLPGDGVGPEIMRQAEKILLKLQQEGATYTWSYGLIGGAAYEQYQDPLPEETLQAAKKADAILLGAVGGPKYDQLPRELRPERGLLRIRRELGLFANLRPAFLFPELIHASTLKAEIVSSIDLLIVRELTGDIYFGTPRGIIEEDGERVGINTMRYAESEIRRIARLAFELAATRRKKVVSVDKANVLEVSELWREVVEEVGKDYPDIELSHLYVDAAAMLLLRKPYDFDVILTGNLFGDILSDEAAMLTGSIGMLPSASLNASKKGIYEPVHGSAPDIAGKNRANPLAMILSLAMAFRYTFADEKNALRIERAVQRALEEGCRTEDIAMPTGSWLSTEEMGDAVWQNF
jgi:3-isopropylmalate dehydrogenase